MKAYEYAITKHTLQRDNKMRVFCSERGECSVEEVAPSDASFVLDALNERGREGWELAEILFGRDGFVCFWKREIPYKQRS